MPMQLDTGAIKAESRSLLRTGEVNPFRMTLFYLLITLVLDMINSGVSYMIDSAGGFTVLSFSFVSILVGLVALVVVVIGDDATVHIDAEATGEIVEAARVFGGHDIGPFQEGHQTG